MGKGFRKGMILVFILSMLTSMPVFAANIRQPTEQVGSITIQLEDTKNHSPKDHVVFHATKIADLVDGKYVMKEAYANLGVDMNLLKTANEMEEACEKLQPVVKKELETVTDSSGKAVLRELPVGVYFIHAADIAKYEKMTDFLVSIPTWNETDKTMEYDITAIPKHSDAEVTNPPSSTKPPTTGDTSNAWMWMALSSGALVVIGVGFTLLVKGKSK